MTRALSKNLLRKQREVIKNTRLTIQTVRYMYEDAGWDDEMNLTREVEKALAEAERKLYEVIKHHPVVKESQ